MNSLAKIETKKEINDQQLLELKIITPYFPHFIEREIDSSYNKMLVLSTYVRIFRDGQWYRIFVMNSYSKLFTDYPRHVIIQRFMENAYKVLILYLSSETSEIDPCQMDEKERLRQIIEHRFL